MRRRASSAFVPLILSIASGNAHSQELLRQIDGVRSADLFGYAVSGAGDVDGDLYDDVIVGVPGDDLVGGANNGSAEVYSGATGGVIWRFEGTAVVDKLGWSVAGVGDVNGDARPDVIVGIPGSNLGGSNSGAATAYSGLDGSVLNIFVGDAAGDELGHSVSGAGDVDGDAHADLIVGARWNDAAGANAGMARVYSGLTGAVLHTFVGDAAGEEFGYAVAGAGNVDGDAYADLIVGAPFSDAIGENRGYARVFSGASGAVLYTFPGDLIGDQLGIAVGNAGDVNGDARDDPMAGAHFADNPGFESGLARVYSGADGGTIYTLKGEGTDSRFGISVAGVGDMDGDARPDVAVGAHHPPPFPGFLKGEGLSGAGTVQVFSGATGAEIFRVFGDDFWDEHGWSVAGAGDVNGDGVPDLIAGAPQFTTSGIGYAKVWSGPPPPPSGCAPPAANGASGWIGYLAVAGLLAGLGWRRRKHLSRWERSARGTDRADCLQVRPGTWFTPFGVGTPGRRDRCRGRSSVCRTRGWISSGSGGAGSGASRSFAAVTG